MAQDEVVEGEKDDGIAVPIRRRGPAKQDEQARKRGVLIVVGMVGLGGLLAGVFLTQMKDSAVYSKPVDELVAQKTKFAGRPVRAEGNLVHGTLVKRDQPCEYRFTITKNGVDVPVRFAQCVVPDTFRDVAGMDVGVTVEGELRADNSFEATNVLAKCPSKYEMKERATKGEQMPHAQVDGT
ncbi:cytochrome c maturation protein CcmE [Pendulispora rubella]|uniref:Cytochrome c maturation protein CcmE n=1 Tax=Pendulispora rubella TaxID=2741070 RepID=A0ABZ2L5K6_9BACT